MTIDPVAAALLGFVTLERLGELVWARSNTARLRLRGGLEHAPGHYRLIVLLHVAWLAGLWILAVGQRPDPALVALYLLVEAGRAWVLATLGRRWTTRLIVVPGETLVTSGPYRVLRHPNYAIVSAEVLILPLAFGLIAYALVFSVLNALVLLVRIRAETQALASTGRAPRPIGKTGERM